MISITFSDSLHPYQERSLSLGRFLCRCGSFTVLWVITNYMFIYSLTLLDATDVIALYTTNVAFIYLLSWVLLQEQFVGIRVISIVLKIKADLSRCQKGLFNILQGNFLTATNNWSYVLPLFRQIQVAVAPQNRRIHAIMI